jgi:hypothetical protein
LILGLPVAAASADTDSPPLAAVFSLTSEHRCCCPLDAPPCFNEFFFFFFFVFFVCVLLSDRFIPDLFLGNRRLQLQWLSAAELDVLLPLLFPPASPWS